MKVKKSEAGFKNSLIFDLNKFCKSQDDCCYCPFFGSNCHFESLDIPTLKSYMREISTGEGDADFDALKYVSPEDPEEHRRKRMKINGIGNDWEWVFDLIKSFIPDGIDISFEDDEKEEKEEAEMPAAGDGDSDFDKMIRDVRLSHPSHYVDGRQFEPKDVIRDWDLNFNLGSAVKYISRAGRKSGNDILTDLKKARVFLGFEIEAIENERKKGETK